MKEQYFEVLAPAGGPESLRAAVYAGADAVYLAQPLGLGPTPRISPGSSWRKLCGSATPGACGST